MIPVNGNSVSSTSNVIRVCTRFNGYVEHLLGSKIKHIESDWTGDYLSFSKLGIT